MQPETVHPRRHLPTIPRQHRRRHYPTTHPSSFLRFHSHTISLAVTCIPSDRVLFHSPAAAAHSVAQTADTLPKGFPSHHNNNNKCNSNPNTHPIPTPTFRGALRSPDAVDDTTYTNSQASMVHQDPPHRSTFACTLTSASARRTSVVTTMVPRRTATVGLPSCTDTGIQATGIVAHPSGSGPRMASPCPGTRRPQVRRTASASPSSCASRDRGQARLAGRGMD